MDKSVKITIIIAVAVLIAIFGGLLVFKSIITTSINPEAGTVSATGEAKLKVIPDLAVIYFLVETKNASAETAKNMNSEILEKVKNALISKGIEEREISTEQFTINENWEWNGTASFRNGFISQYYGKVGLKDYDKAGKAIDAIVDNGGRINSINFELLSEKQKEYKTQALKLASEDARKKAEAIASGLDKKLGDLVSVQASDFYYQPWRIFEAKPMAGITEEKAAAQQAVIDIRPSEQDVTASVTVQYKIK